MAKNYSNDNEKKDAGGNVTVVFKIDLHCAEKVVKSHTFSQRCCKVKIGDNELKKVTVIGKLDPDKPQGTVREKIVGDFSVINNFV